MTEYQVTYHYDKRVSSFEEYFFKTREKGDMEDLHQMRVSVKKLRANWSLMEVVSGGEWTKADHFVLFKHLFKAGGYLREIQVNRDKATQLQEPALVPYMLHLAGLEKRYEENLAPAMNAFDRATFHSLNAPLCDRMQSCPVDVVLKEAVAYMLKLNETIGTLKDQLPDTHRLHQIRIRLKVVLEVLNIMDELVTHTALTGLKLRIKSINQRIGDWHDDNVLLESLKAFVAMQPDIETTDELRSFILRFERQERLKQNSLCELIENFVFEQELRQIEVMI